MLKRLRGLAVQAVANFLGRLHVSSQRTGNNSRGKAVEVMFALNTLENGSAQCFTPEFVGVRSAWVFFGRSQTANLLSG